MKIIILVLSADRGVYKSLSKASRKTWAAEELEGVKIFFYYGYMQGRPRPQKGQVIEDGSDLICGNTEGLHTIGFKTISSFQYLLESYDFDYIFRCCAGSYVDQKNLKKFVENKPRKKFYCGAIGNIDGIRYASGSGYILSRDLVKYVVDNGKLWNHSLIDDMALGKVLGGIDIDKSAKRFNIPNNATKEALVGITEDDYYHFHFRKQPALMFKIHEALGDE